jgi:alpha,alpha-trehalase
MNLSKFFFLLSLLLFVACRQSTADQTTEAPNVLNELSSEKINSKLVPPTVLYGDLLKDVQMAQVFPDGKTFVDCTPKIAVNKILDNYTTLKGQSDFDLKKFILAHFDEPRKYASGFKTDTTKNVMEHINSLWDVLTRQADTAGEGTLIPLPKPYIVPGGRFGEIYYWDSYFTMLGLQASGREDMIENMVDNFAYLIENVGFIPNGNRTYFLGRSQPPFFALMVSVLAEMKGDKVYQKYLPALEKEYAFWMEGMEKMSPTNRFHRRLVRLGDGTIMNRYWDDLKGPREESYREDVELAHESGRPAEEVYKDIRAACESGWDFSSRWLEDGKSLKTIRTTKIIPVDLNALIFNIEMTISKAHTIDDNSEKATFYLQRADQRKKAVLDYCYHSPAGFFLDFDIENGEPTYIPSLAGVFPLFFNMAPEKYALAVSQNIEEDFLRPGGLLSTVHTTGQQWDAPNGWAPLQWMTIKGLRNYGYTELAEKIKMYWININRKVYKETGKMVEKYNVQNLDIEAGGGEYPVQDGFGWSNGVLLKLMTED